MMTHEEIRLFYFKFCSDLFYNSVVGIQFKDICYSVSHVILLNPVSPSMVFQCIGDQSR